MYQHTSMPTNVVYYFVGLIVHAFSEKYGDGGLYHNYGCLCVGVAYQIYCADDHEGL